MFIVQILLFVVTFLSLILQIFVNDSVSVCGRYAGVVWFIFHVLRLLHPKLRNTDPHNVTHSLTSRNPRERMFVVQISLLVVTFLSLISQTLSLMQTIQEVNSHPRIGPCVNMWSVTFFFLFFLCHLLNVGACVRHIAWNAKWSGSH